MHAIYIDRKPVLMIYIINVRPVVISEMEACSINDDCISLRRIIARDYVLVLLKWSMYRTN